MKDYFVREQSISEQDARDMFYLVDSKGLVANNRGDALPAHKKLLSRREDDMPRLKSLEEVVTHVRPTALMGLSTVGSTFTEPILRKMAEYNNRPIVFPLSNPSSKSECTFVEALDWTDGKCLFASGSPFDDEKYKGKVHVAGQGNNAYIFPALGLGAILVKAKLVTPKMIYASASSLANSLTDEETKAGLIYPEIGRIRDVSAVIAAEVILAAQVDNVDREQSWRSFKDDKAKLIAKVREDMYDPKGPEHDLGQKSVL